MEKWIIMVESYVTDPSREKEVEDWYREIHMPDILKTPGYVGAKRYVMKDPKNGRGKFVALYEVETDDIDKTLKIRNEYIAQEKRDGRTSAQMLPGLMLPIWQWIVCKEQMSFDTKGK